MTCVTEVSIYSALVWIAYRMVSLCIVEYMYNLMDCFKTQSAILYQMYCSYNDAITYYHRKLTYCACTINVKHF